MEFFFTHKKRLFFVFCLPVKFFWKFNAATRLSPWTDLRNIFAEENVQGRWRALTFVNRGNPYITPGMVVVWFFSRFKKCIKKGKKWFIFQGNCYCACRIQFQFFFLNYCWGSELSNWKVQKFSKVWYKNVERQFDSLGWKIIVPCNESEHSQIWNYSNSNLSWFWSQQNYQSINLSSTFCYSKKIINQYYSLSFWHTIVNQLISLRILAIKLSTNGSLFTFWHKIVNQ